MKFHFFQVSRFQLRQKIGVVGFPVLSGIDLIVNAGDNQHQGNGNHQHGKNAAFRLLSVGRIVLGSIVGIWIHEDAPPYF